MVDGHCAVSDEIIFVEFNSNGCPGATGGSADPYCTPNEAVAKLEKLKTELGGLITKVQGTGLLFSCELAPQFKGYGIGSTEEWLRERGLGVIHGGTNSLRFTPHFAITSEEVDLVVEHVRHALLHGPRKSRAEAA